MQRIRVVLGLCAVGLWIGRAGSGAEAAAPAVRLAVDLRDGSHLVGKPDLATIEFHAAFGKVSLPLEQVATLEMLDDRERATVTLRNGDRLTGVPRLDALKLEALFGPVLVPAEHVRRLAVIPAAGAAAKGLTLWNTLGSRAEVEHSAAGPGGVCRGGSFGEGVAGGGYVARVTEPALVAFPREVLNVEAGCIEVWAKLSGLPADLRDGSNPALFDLTGPEGGFMIHLNGNDGAASGGLCARAGRLGSCGTGDFGSWSYERALGPRWANTWHHYALVWDRRGVPGLNDPARRLAVYLDGALNTGRWGGGEDAPAPLSAGELALLTTQHLRQGVVAFDNLKVWDFAKTDFSDRFDGASLPQEAFPGSNRK